jgi:oxygen-independent coproporphyrinogen-3 oxidase
MAGMPEWQRLRDLDPAFLRRYDLHGPRYTSYPPVPQWNETIDADALERHLAATRERSADRPLSIYVHLPFCITRCSFCACNVIVSPKMEEVSDPYLDQLEQETEMYARRLDSRRPVVQLHWGGGTPTYLSPDQLRRAHAITVSRFRLADDAEQSIEIHVNWTSDEHLRALAELGFNRLSLGVQDFDERTQAAINRFQTHERTRAIVELARALGFQGINFDLVYGLPHQTAASFADTIDKVIDLKPDRLAVYNFAYLPGQLAHQRALDPATLPPPEEKLRIFLEAHDRFIEAGYRYIGMDHFALPNDELARAYDEGTMQRNFMGFTTRAGADLIAMGVSAIGGIDGLYVQNVKKLPRYRRALAAGRFPVERGFLLSRDDRIRRDVIGGLMCRDHIDKREVEARHGIVFDEYFAEELRRLTPMLEDGLLTVSADSLDVTFLGRLLVRNIAMVFDAHLKRPGKERVFSKTI